MVAFQMSVVSYQWPIWCYTGM